MVNFYSVIGISALSLLVACTASQPEKRDMELGEQAGQNETTEVVEVKPVSATIVYPYSVRKEPGRKTEYVSRLSRGEQVTYLGEEQPGNFDAEDRKRTYKKVELVDGTIGWTHGDIVIPESRPAVFLQEGIVYKRPDLLTKSDKVYSKMDVIAVVTDGDWMKVVGQPTGESWISEGWIRTGSVSYDALDIAAAKFIKDALEKKGAEREQAIAELRENKDLAKSILFQQFLEENTSN